MAETKEEWKRRIGNGPAIGASALPTRGSGSKNQAEWDRMKRWEKEHDAARQLAKAGVRDLNNLAEAPDRLRSLGG